VPVWCRFLSCVHVWYYGGMKNYGTKQVKSISVLVLGLVCVLGCGVAIAASSYNFEGDTIGVTPQNISVTSGTFDVQDEVTLGKSMRAVMQIGVIAGVIFDDFTGSLDQSVVWKQAYSNDMGRGGFTLRAQDTDTSVANSAGARLGYLFHVYDSGSVYIWKVGTVAYTPLWSGSLAKTQPRWFRASAVGDSLTFEYSNDGTDFTTLATVTDSTYTSGKVQYTAGYGAGVSRDYIDDVVITDLDAPSVSVGRTLFVHPPMCHADILEESITLGESATLSWESTWPTHRTSTFYTRVPGAGLYPQEVNSVSISPQHTATYQISVFNLFGAHFCEDTVRVFDEHGEEILSPKTQYMSAQASDSIVGRFVRDLINSIALRR